MGEKDSVFLVKPGDYNKKPRYEVKTGESLHRRISNHCVIQPMAIPNVKSHLLIVAHHPLGWGDGGWDSYEENLDIVESSKVSDKLLLSYADKYARQLAKKGGYTYFDLKKVNTILKEEKRIQNAKNRLESLTS